MKALLAFVAGTVAGVGATVAVMYAWSPRPVPPAAVVQAPPATRGAAATPLPSPSPGAVAESPIPSGEPPAPPASLSPHNEPAAATAAAVAVEPMAPPAVGLTDLDYLAARRMALPVDGVDLQQVRDTFAEMRGARVHEAVDILAPRGTPVRATDDGVVRKLFNSRAGGLTVYQFDPGERYSYYYAHLDSYAEGLAEGRNLRKGDLVGFVGTTGNAPRDTPHLHFAVFRLDAAKEWWKGTAVNPYSVWALQQRSP